MSVAFHEAR